MEVMGEGSLTGSIKTNMFSVSGNFAGNAQVSGALTIQKGGVIEGDDINNESVANAVKWFFNDESLEIIGRQWMVDLGQ